MNPERFERMCEEIGAEIEREVPDEVTVCRNRDGDELRYLHFVSDEYGTHDHVELHLDDLSVDTRSQTPSLDEFERRGDAIVLDDVSGSRSSRGYGTTGFRDSEIRFTSEGTRLYEQH